MPRRRTILSIDGGGIRGIIPAMVLNHIERETGRPASALFDLIVGTSTGGIIALGLSLPRSHNPHLSRYSARDLAELYATRGGEIFSRTLWRRMRSMRGVVDENYDADALESVLDAYFGGARLGSLRTPTMVTTYDIERRTTLFLKSFKPEHYDVKCTEAARATSAAPTYFEPATLTIDAEERALIDGGVYINSPAVSAYAEALSLFPGDTITLVSLGTGELIRPIPREKAAGWGAAGWVMPLLDCMFDGAAKAADHQMRSFLGASYQRFQLSLEHANDDMDDASEENINALFQAAETLIARESDGLRDLVEYLKSVQGEARPAGLPL